MRKTISVRGVDQEAIDLLSEMRVEDRRLVGALVSDAIRCYYDTLYSDEEDADGAELAVNGGDH